ncbi:MAG: hypothetical protein P1U61_07960 [Legionellaceae bacterium]|nr:hypothetical protein [Legionellaceae bacterium]
MPRKRNRKVNRHSNAEDKSLERSQLASYPPNFVREGVSWASLFKEEPKKEIKQEVSAAETSVTQVPSNFTQAGVPWTRLFQNSRTASAAVTEAIEIDVEAKQQKEQLLKELLSVRDLVEEELAESDERVFKKDNEKSLFQESMECLDEIQCEMEKYMEKHQKARLNVEKNVRSICTSVRELNIRMDNLEALLHAHFTSQSDTHQQPTPSF